ncbi:MAG TPA: BatA domain-containing protein [Phycisphaerae bacterium]|nr:BatA domain-containing protein [Phycisphaerae bacterium]HPS52694.1 BatA domain-containing protein [Phycisphaerae bacterium]
MTFLSPWLLLGLAAVAVPVLLHMFWKSRAKAYAFATLMFLHSAVVRTARRRKIQNWLLMLLRCGLIAMLTLAAAEPISRAGGFWGGKQRNAIVVLDDSFSMTAKAGDMSAFENARAGVLELTARGDAPSQIAVLLTAGPTPSGFARLTSKIADIRQMVSSAAISYAHASPDASLAGAAELAAQTPAEVFIFSDFQKNSFNLQKMLHNSSLDFFKKNSPVYLIRSRKDSPSNLAITNLSVQGPNVRGASVNLMVTASNYSQADETVSVELVLPDTPPLRKMLDLPADTSQVVAMPVELSQNGEIAGQVRMKTDDAIRCDDARFFAFTPRPVVRVAVICDDENTDDPSAAGRVLSLALDWRTDAEKTTTPWPINVVQIKPSDLNATTLKTVDAVFLCGVGGMSPAISKNLVDFARSGGVVMFFAGPAFDAGVYSSTLDGRLLPGGLAAPVGSIGPDAPAWKVNSIDSADRLLGGLYQSADDFPQMNVQRFVPVKPSKDTKVLMSLENSFPLLMRKDVGHGEVFWCTTAATPKWSNLPATGVFLPVVLRAALWQATGGDVPMCYVPGDFVPLTGEGGWRFLPQISYTKKVTGKTAANGVVVDCRTAPGLVEYSAGNFNGVFALSPDPAESDAECYDEDELLKKFHAADFANVYIGDDLGQVLAGASRERRGYNWRSLLACLAILTLLVELAVSNRINVKQKAAVAEGS